VLCLALVPWAAAPGPAAGSSCSEAVLADWFDNGRVDRLYALGCYEGAVDAVPSDIRDYSDAEEVILRARQSAVRGKLAPGGIDPTPDDPSGGAGRSGEADASRAAASSAGTSSPPFALLVLGGLATALLVAGGLGARARGDARSGDVSDDAPQDEPKE
jgi:hypothetical protein